jgi:hypothetical protein
VYSSTTGNDVRGKVRAWRTIAGNVSAALFDDVAGTQIGSTVTVAGASSIAIPENGRTISLPPGPAGARTVVIEP